MRLNCGWDFIPATETVALRVENLLIVFDPSPYCSRYVRYMSDVSVMPGKKAMISFSQSEENIMEALEAVAVSSTPTKEHSLQPPCL